MRRVYLSLGSNIEPEKNVAACLKLLKERFRVHAVSPVYETDPVGPAGSNQFWNLAVSLDTEETDETLVRQFREVEDSLGRVRSKTNRFAPRTIDIDLLPQPDYQKLAFIIVPLAEIAATARDPETGKSFGELASAVDASQGLRLVRIS